MFKGNIANQTFNGPGMLKWKLDETLLDGGQWVYDKKTCFDFPKLIQDDKSVSVIGNWVDGVLDGNVKVGYKDKTVITQIIKGELHGVTR